MDEKVLIGFDSTQQALRAEMLLEYADIEIDTRPTPHEITAGCALSIEIPALHFLLADTIIRNEKVEIKGYYKKIDGIYRSYQAEKQGKRNREGYNV